jgi:hypothetical protein
MKNERTIKIVAVVATAMFFLSLITVGYFVQINKNKNADLNNERLKSEKLLSEKLDLDKQIRNFKNEVNSLLGKNKELDKYLLEANDKILAKERTINKLAKENASLANLKKENEAIREIRDNLDNRINEMTSKNADLSVEIEILKNRIAELINDNDKMSAQLKEHEVNRLVDHKAGNFRIETQKKRNNKLTIKSSKTNFLAISYNMPAEYSGKVNTEFFRIVLQNPEGGSVQGDQQTSFSTETVKLSARIDKMLSPIASERVNVVFKPSEKLVEGIYTIILYEGNYIMGSAQVRLAR